MKHYIVIDDTEDTISLEEMKSLLPEVERVQAERVEEEVRKHDLSRKIICLEEKDGVSRGGEISLGALKDLLDSHEQCWNDAGCCSPYEDEISSLRALFLE